MEEARRQRFDLLRKWGDAVWTEVETEIERRIGPGYDPAGRLITDLAQLAKEMDRFEEFPHRLDDIRDQPARRARFLEVLAVR